MCWLRLLAALQAPQSLTERGHACIIFNRYGQVQLRIRAGALFVLTPFSFLHFPVNIERVQKSAGPMQNIPDKTIISCRSPGGKVAFGSMDPAGVIMLIYYLEAIDER